MRALQRLAIPTATRTSGNAPAAVAGKTELDAMVAYLQGLGRHAPRGRLTMLAGIVTLVWMLAFVAVWIWAWRPSRRPGFDAAARLAVEDDGRRPTMRGRRADEHRMVVVRHRVHGAEPVRHRLAAVVDRQSAAPATPKPEDISHYWDGDITEYNKPMPRWWINGFFLSIAFGMAYLTWFGGWGDFKGLSGWSSQAQYAKDKALADAQLDKTYAQYAGKPIDVIAQDPRAEAGPGDLRQHLRDLPRLQRARRDRLSQPDRRHLEMGRHARRRAADVQQGAMARCRPGARC